MRIFTFLTITLLSVVSLSAQVDQCSGAFSALNRVKEEITPDLAARNKAKDEYAADRIRTLLSTIEAAANACRDQPELIYYRAILAREANSKDRNYYERKLKESGYTPAYDPFSLPPSALIEKDSDVISQKWALVVGVNKFKVTGLNTLKFSAKDSEDFAHYLTDPNGGRFQPGHVKSLTNEEATIQGVREGLSWLRFKAQPSDLVVIYFSSHGSERILDPSGVSYIILHDTDISPEKLYGTSLQMIELVQTLNREIRARRVVLFLDTCYSGDAIGVGSKRVGMPLSNGAPAAANTTTGVFSAAFQNLKSGIGRAVITASRSDEVSWEDYNHQNGYFTRSLLAALTSGAGANTLGQIFPKIREDVLISVSKDHSGQRQTPTSQFSEQSDSIVISVPEGR